MLQLKINGQYTLQVRKQDRGFLVDGLLVGQGLEKIGPDLYAYHIGKVVHRIEVLGKSLTQKTLRLRIDGKLAEVEVADELDMLQERMGVKATAAYAVPQVKAPMPGLLQRWLVSEGQQVRKGDKLLVLEAMKMENVIRSPRDGQVSRLCAPAGENVERGTLLLTFATS